MQAVAFANASTMNSSNTTTEDDEIFIDEHNDIVIEGDENKENEPLSCTAVEDDNTVLGLDPVQLAIAHDEYIRKLVAEGTLSQQAIDECSREIQEYISQELGKKKNQKVYTTDEQMGTSTTTTKTVRFIDEIPGRSLTTVHLVSRWIDQEVCTTDEPMDWEPTDMDASIETNATATTSSSNDVFSISTTSNEGNNNGTTSTITTTASTATATSGFVNSRGNATGTSDTTTTTTISNLVLSTTTTGTAATPVVSVSATATTPVRAKWDTYGTFCYKSYRPVETNDGDTNAGTSSTTKNSNEGNNSTTASTATTTAISGYVNPWGNATGTSGTTTTTTSNLVPSTTTTGTAPTPVVSVSATATTPVRTKWYTCGKHTFCYNNITKTMTFGT
jgi:hypothetical protein